MTCSRRAIATIACLLAAGTLAALRRSHRRLGRAHSQVRCQVGPALGSRRDADEPRSQHARGGDRAGVAKEVADPLEADSYPAPASVKHARPRRREGRRSDRRRGRAVERGSAPASWRRCRRWNAAPGSAAAALTPVPGGESIGGNGTIPIPTDVPEVVQKVIAGANEIADFPYVFGGGHASFIDNAYDCSGSVSYALAAGGLLSAPETSGELESWGAPGPGSYITVYANAGHTYMYVDGILYDTAGRSGVYASRWQVRPTDNAGYVVRHWPGSSGATAALTHLACVLVSLPMALGGEAETPSNTGLGDHLRGLDRPRLCRPVRAVVLRLPRQGAIEAQEGLLRLSVDEVAAPPRASGAQRERDVAEDGRRQRVALGGVAHRQAQHQRDLVQRA